MSIIDLPRDSAKPRLALPKKNLIKASRTKWTRSGATPGLIYLCRGCARECRLERDNNLLGDGRLSVLSAGAMLRTWTRRYVIQCDVQ